MWGCIVIMEEVETTIVCWGYIEIMEKNMETAVVYWVNIGMMENRMETAIQGLEKPVSTTFTCLIPRPNTLNPKP